VYNLLIYQKGDNCGCFNLKYLRVFLPLYKKYFDIFRHIIKVYTSDRHDTDSKKITLW